MPRNLNREVHLKAQTKWSESELDYLRTAPATMTDADISAILRRSPSAVINKRWEMKKQALATLPAVLPAAGTDFLEEDEVDLRLAFDIVRMAYHEGTTVHFNVGGLAFRLQK